MSCAGAGCSPTSRRDCRSGWRGVPSRPTTASTPPPHRCTSVTWCRSSGCSICSDTEFSYMLLQAADDLHLYRELDVELQTGGADQWGNITAGLELIRKVEGGTDGAEPAHGLSYPLLTGAGGQKVGKSDARSVRI